MSTKPEHYREKYAEALAGPEGRPEAAAGPVNPLDDSHYSCGRETFTLREQLPLENLTRSELRELMREIGAVWGRDDVTAARLRDWINEKDARIARLEEDLETQTELVAAGKSGRNSLANLGSIAAMRARRLTTAASDLAGRGRKTLRRTGRTDENDRTGDNE